MRHFGLHDGGSVTPARIGVAVASVVGTLTIIVDLTGSSVQRAIIVGVVDVAGIALAVLVCVALIGVAQGSFELQLAETLPRA
jgi:hypothetical protein